MDSAGSVISLAFICDPLSYKLTCYKESTEYLQRWPQGVSDESELIHAALTRSL
jgi:hypothetical protein